MPVTFRTVLKILETPVQLEEHILRHFLGRGTIPEEMVRDTENHGLLRAQHGNEGPRHRVSHGLFGLRCLIRLNHSSLSNNAVGRAGGRREI
jgi:hypothetical protein